MFEQPAAGSSYYGYNVKILVRVRVQNKFLSFDSDVLYCRVGPEIIVKPDDTAAAATAGHRKRTETLRAG